MSLRRSNSFLNWSLTGTLAGSLILSGAVHSQAGPFSLPGRSASKTNSQQNLVEHEQAARVITTKAEDQASGTAADSNADAEARIVQNVKSVRLNFLESSWKSVLASYAEQAGVELVADPKLIPRSRFTRRDRSFYTHSEALKILNRELQQFDVKLVPQADKLVLMDLPSSGPKYRRPTVSGGGLVTEHELPESQIPPAFETRKTPRRIVDSTDSDVETADGRAIPISTDSSDVPAGRIQLTAATESPSLDPRAATMMSVQMTHRPTKDIANVLYQAFQKHADLLSDGPDGLPAIRVYDPAPKTKQAVGKIALAPPKKTVKFTIAMDHSRGRLTIQAPAVTARAVASMVRKLDAPDPVHTSVQLFASAYGERVETMAEMVQKQLTRISRARNRGPSLDQALAFQGDGAQPANGNDDQQAAPADGQPEAPANPRQPGEKPPGLSPDLIGGLKGDVAVESVPELGVMILRGNQKDVDRVMEIIREIEKLSAGATPDVHLLMLKNTNSEALAELLTQVYERLNGRRRPAGGTGAAATGGSQSVTILPVVKPNAVLIVAAEADMEAILRLADELDQPVDPDAEFQMFRLKSGVAEQVLETIQAFYEERKGLGARVLAVADVRTNSVLVHARPSDLKEVANLIKELDQVDSASVSRMKIFPLKNAVATETADVLQQTIQSVLNPPATRQSTGGQGGPGAQGGAAAGGQGNAALRAVKSTVLQFLSSDGPGERLLQSGILADIRITADGRTNSLVVTAPESSMLLVEELIKQLDRQTTTVAEIKVFGLTNSDARSMVTLLEALFATSAGNNQNAQDRLGIQVAGAEDASSGLVPLKFSVDARTNSIVAVGAAESLRVVEAILIRLDESEVRQRQSIVFRLKNIRAADVATAVNNFLTSRRDLEQSGDGLVSPFEQIEREVIVVPEGISNTLLISATPRYFNEIKDLVVTIDAAPQQVTIQALLVEVTLSNTDEFGVELGLQDSVLFRRSVIDQLTTLQQTTTAQNGVQTTTQNVISQTAVPGFLFNNQQLGNNTSVSPGIVGKQGLTSFSLGRQNGELGYGGLVLAAGSEGVSVLLRALAATQRVDVLSRPQIRTLDNQLAVIQVGQEVPVVNGVTTTGLSVNPQVEIRQAGIILQVVPRISPDGRVVMDVAAERSTYLPEDQGVTIYSDAATGRTIRAPRKEISTARASVAVSNEQTVVLGGMISSSNTSIQRKVPVIGDLPFLGLPFRYNFNQNIKKELLIFLTPRVIKTDADSEYIKQVETARIHFMEQDAEEIHGPIMAAPPPVDPTMGLPPSMSPATTVPLIDDPSIPTTQVQPDIIVPPPAPPVDDDGLKLMRRGSTKPAARRIAMSK